MLDFNDLKAIAEKCGFTHFAPLNIRSLEFLPEVRDMCASDKCNMYGKSWSCPPACGPLEEMQNRVESFSEGLIVQTVGDIEDSYDWEGIQETAKKHGENFDRMWDELENGQMTVLAMGAGACMRCETCTYPDEQCRFPDKMSSSMEACGLFVSKVCTDNALAYNYGQDKMAFTSCFLLK